MKFAHLIPLAAILVAVNSFAQAQPQAKGGQGAIYRCGNTYTNDAAEARTKNCKIVDGGFVTVVEGTRVQGNAAATAPVKVATNSPSAGARVDSTEQKARDNDAREILESELKKAEARQAELAKEFKNGEPDKLGPETRNYQKYLDRVSGLKASMARNENDIAGIKRELGRVPASK
jgi:hypothetical protein